MDDMINYPFTMGILDEGTAARDKMKKGISPTDTPAPIKTGTNDSGDDGQPVKELSHARSIKFYKEKNAELDTDEEQTEK